MSSDLLSILSFYEYYMILKYSNSWWAWEEREEESKTSDTLHLVVGWEGGFKKEIRYVKMGLGWGRGAL